ncbi:uncharacterized protein LY89DRAFT_688062 [Mollisia scopiformis]|uniref:Uncharacterized protein n=1 Tax=Mollisia scopiformis TaxID=149040 RepID=A0A194WWF9_MOLSC|nr:uncharacterized protein LY89DRAFT_688062 [Mollisia scopiformis]KUJ12313.1 hypothetical protein LY89DRAFT_688062 [Mollisia scopiformis]
MGARLSVAGKHYMTLQYRVCKFLRTIPPPQGYCFDCGYLFHMKITRLILFIRDFSRLLFQRPFLFSSISIIIISTTNPELLPTQLDARLTQGIQCFVQFFSVRGFLGFVSASGYVSRRCNYGKAAVGAHEIMGGLLAVDAREVWDWEDDLS